MRRRKPDPTNYTMMGIGLEETSDIQYLGVQFERDLRWNKQTEYVE